MKLKKLNYKKQQQLTHTDHKIIRHGLEIFHIATKKNDKQKRESKGMKIHQRFLLKISSQEGVSWF